MERGAYAPLSFFTRVVFNRPTKITAPQTATLGADGMQTGVLLAYEV